MAFINEQNTSRTLSKKRGQHNKMRNFSKELIYAKTYERKTNVTESNQRLSCIELEASDLRLSSKECSGFTLGRRRYSTKKY